VACFFIFRVRLGFFLFDFLSPLFFLLLVFPSLGVFSLAGSFRYFFLVLGFRRALYVAWVCFAWVYFLLEPFFLWRQPCVGVRRISGLSRLLSRFKTAVVTIFLCLSLCLLLGVSVQLRGSSSSTCTRPQGIATVGRWGQVSPKSRPPGTPCTRPRIGTCAWAWRAPPCRQKWLDVSLFEISTSTWPRTGHVNLLLIPILRRMGSLGREAEEEFRELFRLFWGEA
jgi:hypothetical protein